MAAFERFEGLEIGLLALQAAKVGPRVKTHQLFHRVEHGGLQSVTSFAFRVVSWTLQCLF
jgi:hypothetical protein